ncbi:MAG: hypothetical protein LH468_01035 [Nocardioides sp.]|nr:hypothetical protein [Nocardioides sp.]
MSEFSTWAHPPGPGPGQQCSPQFDEPHQLWPSQIGYPDPIVYMIDVLLRTHSFTTSKVLVISASGRPRTSFDASGNTFAPGTKRTLPPSTIYGFNGTFGGKTFSLHFPHHGFVGDLFTVNGTASPVLEVKRRRYRFRFLDASLARIYEFTLMASTQGPRSSVSLELKGDELEGQYRIPDAQQCMTFTQIASDGGLLPFAIQRDSFELWPAKRREVIIDFTRYQDGIPTTMGDVVYLTNVMKMPNGRMWTNSSRFSRPIPPTRSRC